MFFTSVEIHLLMLYYIDDPEVKKQEGQTPYLPSINNETAFYISHYSLGRQEQDKQNLCVQDVRFLNFVGTTAVPTSISLTVAYSVPSMPMPCRYAGGAFAFDLYRPRFLIRIELFFHLRTGFRLQLKVIWWLLVVEFLHSDWNISFLFFFGIGVD